MYENERDIELYFRGQVKRVLRGRAYKFVSPGSDGVPDRIAIIPRKGREALVRFVEMKRPGGKLRKIQVLRQGEMRMLGAVCVTLDSKEAVDKWVDGMREALV
ncbi:MAG: VRR-NUC domain-containing protein [Acidaminococcaceae bacterium]|nr:VRR-NUC domain-containing protein [Acidaminococcaceae bacterium]